MATIPQTWSILNVITILAIQLCIGRKACVIWSSAGSEVLRGSNFVVYCTFNCNAKGSMYRYVDSKLKPQKGQEHNATTLSLNVENITERWTFSCKCRSEDRVSTFEPCGLDISPGYPPDIPQNLTCFQNVTSGEKRDVVCTWKRGRDTLLNTKSELCVRTTSGNHTDGPFSYLSSNKGPNLSVKFPVSSSVQAISVKVQTHNKLGAAESPTFNYTLSDIVMPPPPVLKRAECSSQACEVTVGRRTKHLEIQYRTVQQAWTTHPDFGVQTGSQWIQSVSSLEPYRLYYFRARTKFSTGLWSQWSANISNWTQEEAPDKELDVWYTESSEFNPMPVYWKKLNDSDARGKILDYQVRVHNLKTGFTFTNVASAKDSHYSVPPCGSCEVTLFARNSKGLSPPATIPSLHKTAEPPQDVHVTADNHSVIVSWRKPVTSFPPSAYLVQWYPEDRRVEEFQWVRLGRNENRAVITDMKPYECYEGEVYVLYESAVGKARFTGVSTLESAPTGGPSVKEHVEGDKVTLTWTKPPRKQRRGCISKYTIYIKTPESRRSYSVSSSETKFIIEGLPPASYWLWMTAWTAQGEGPDGTRINFFIEQESQAVILGVCVIVLVIVLLLVCVCQTSAVQQRLRMVFHCLLLDVIPDPANSKWAKEFGKEKGRMDLQLQLSSSSGTEEEDEPITVNVEELHEESINNSTPATDVSSQLYPHTGLGPVAETAALLYPHTSYIKSFSHDSDSSDHTQTSLETNTTLDYISAHWPEDGIEDEEEGEGDEGGSMDDMSFFPSPRPSACIGTLVFGGQLTLDAVKIDCSGVFENG